jgi:hypothetical protein
MFVVRGARIGRQVTEREHCGLVFYPADCQSDNDRVGEVLIYRSKMNVISPSESMLTLPYCVTRGSCCDGEQLGNATINARVKPQYIAILVVLTSATLLATLFVFFTQCYFSSDRLRGNSVLQY